MKQLTEVQAAYIAAFWDGEGTIGIWAQKRENRPMPCYFRVGISAVNTKRQILDSIREEIGIGNINAHRLANKNGNVCFKLVLSQRQGEGFLKQILPYLRLKAKQARLALEFLKLQRNCGRGGIPESVWLAQKELYLQCGPLNHRGTGFFFPNEAYNASFGDKRITIPKPYPKRKLKGRLCETEGCGGKHYAKGMCFIHYRKANPEIYKRKWIPVGVRGKTKCLQCEIEFEFFSKTPKFCSVQCRRKYRKALEKKRRHEITSLAEPG